MNRYKIDGQTESQTAMDRYKTAVLHIFTELYPFQDKELFAPLAH